MAPRTDFLTQQRQQIDARLQQLRPAHEEYLTLLEAKEALEGLEKPGSARPSTGSSRSRPPARIPQHEACHDALARARMAAAGRAAPGRRRRAGGTRADQALQLIKSNPGMTVPQIADKMGIRQNYLYRVTAALQKDGSVKRKGQGFVAA